MKKKYALIMLRMVKWLIREKRVDEYKIDG